MADYPRRQAFFAQKFIRLMVKTAAAQTIGVDAFALLTIVATTEDARRYAGPVTFFNVQLMMLLGIGSLKRLVAARNRACDAGWLVYKPGSKGVAGMYHVSIPAELCQIPDGPSDESDSFSCSDSEPQTEPFRHLSGTLSSFKRNGKGASFLPSPNPSPSPKKESETDSPPFLEIAEEWNQKMELRQRLTGNRRKAIRARWKDPFWRERWREAIALAAASPFCRGQNDRGWKADLDWFLKPESVTRLVEGKYSPVTSKAEAVAVEIDRETDAPPRRRK